MVLALIVTSSRILHATPHVRSYGIYHTITADCSHPPLSYSGFSGSCSISINASNNPRYSAQPWIGAGVRFRTPPADNCVSSFRRRHGHLPHRTTCPFSLSNTAQQQRAVPGSAFYIRHEYCTLLSPSTIIISNAAHYTTPLNDYHFSPCITDSASAQHH